MQATPTHRIGHVPPQRAVAKAPHGSPSNHRQSDRRTAKGKSIGSPHQVSRHTRDRFFPVISGPPFNTSIKVVNGGPKSYGYAKLMPCTTRGRWPRRPFHRQVDAGPPGRHGPCKAGKRGYKSLSLQLVSIQLSLFFRSASGSFFKSQARLDPAGAPQSCSHRCSARLANATMKRTRACLKTKAPAPVPVSARTKRSKPAPPPPVPSESDDFDSDDADNFFSNQAFSEDDSDW